MNATGRPAIPHAAVRPHRSVRCCLLLILWAVTGCEVSDSGPMTPPWTVGCGRQVGDTVCELTLMGYGHPTSLNPLQHPPFALEIQLRQLIQQAPRPHVLLLLGGAWCPSCREATAMAMERMAEIAPHITMINVLMEGDTPTQPARKSHLDEWRKTYAVRFSVVADGYETPMAARDALGFREAAIVVDRKTGVVIARAATLAILWPQLAGLAK